MRDAVEPGGNAIAPSSALRAAPPRARRAKRIDASTGDGPVLSVPPLALAFVPMEDGVVVVEDRLLDVLMSLGDGMR